MTTATGPASSPAAGRAIGMSWLDGLALAALGIALAFAFFTPPDANQGQVARLFYVHVPVVMVAYLSLGVAFVGSAMYLVRRTMRWDHLAVAGAEVGVVLTGLTLVLGMIWAKPTWGVYWTWSARLTLTAIMFFVYLGYLTLRRAVTDPEARARRSAYFGVLAIVQIPIIHFSVQWWRDIHQPPTVLRPDGTQMDTVLFTAFLAGLVAYSLVGAALVRRRYVLARLDLAVHEALQSDTGAVAGEAVTAPRLAGSEGAS